jgi:hypothetical protein
MSGHGKDFLHASGAWIFDQSIGKILLSHNATPCLANG